MKAIRFGLRTKLALLFPLIAAIPLAVLGFYSLLLAKQYIAEEKPRDNLAVASTVAQFVDDHLSVLTTAIAAEARKPVLAAAVASRDESRLTPMLLSFHQAHPSFEAVFVLDRNGIALATSLADKSVVGRDFSYRDYYKGALATGQTYVSEPYVGAATGKPSVGIATPVRDAAGDIQGPDTLHSPDTLHKIKVSGHRIKVSGQGFLVGSLSLDRLSDFVGNVKLGETGHAYLVSRSGLIIAHRDKTKVLGSATGSPEPLRKALAGGSGAQDDTGEGGEAALVAFAPVSRLGWAAIVEQERAEAYGHALDAIRDFAAAIAVCLAITIGFGLDLASRITSPVSALQEGARQLARGDLSHRVVVKSGDELEGLAESFNQMAESLARLDEGKVQAARRMASLLDISAATASSLDLDHILELAYEQIHRLLDVSTFYVALYDGEKDELSFEIFIDKGQALEKFTRRIADGGGLTGWIVRTRKPLLIRDMQVEKTPVEAITVGEPTRSWLGLPLLVQERVVGVLSVQSYEPDAFDEADLRMLETAGNQIAMAVENARLYKTEKQHTARLKVIGEVGRQIAAILDLDELLHRVVATLVESLGYYYANILLVDAAAGEIVLRASAGQTGRAFEGLRLKIGEQGITSWVAGAGQPLLVNDVTQEPRYYFVEELKDTHSELALPIKAKGQVIGVMDVQSAELNAFDEGDLSILTALADQLAVAMENARLYAEVRQQVKELGALLKGSEAIVRVTDLNAILDVVLDQALLLVGRGRGSVLLLDRETNSLQIAASRGLPPEVVMDFNQRRVAPTAGSFGIALETGDMVEIPHARADPRVLHEVGAIPEKLTNVPLKTDRGMVGILAIDALPRSDQERRLLRALADLAAAAIEKARLLEMSRQRAQEIEALAEVGRAIGSTLDLGRVLETIVARATVISHSDEGGIFELDEAEPRYITQNQSIGAEGVLRITASYNASQEFVRAVNEAGVRVGEGAIGQAVATRAPTQVVDTEAEAGYRFREIAAIDGIRSILAVPMLKGEEMLGGIVLWRKRPGAFSPREVALLTAVADQAAIAVENARLYAGLKEKAEDLSFLLDTSLILGSSLDLDVVLQGLVERITGSLAVTLSRITLLDEAGENLVVRATHPMHGLKLETTIGGIIPLATAPCHREVVQSGKPLLIGAGAREQRGKGAEEISPLLLSTPAPQHRRHAARAMSEAEQGRTLVRGLSSAYLVPLKRGELVLGVLSLGEMRNEERAPLTPEKMGLCLAVAGYAARAVENAQIYEKLARSYEELQNAQAQLVQAAKMTAVGELAAGVAHEINNPLTVILGYLELLLVEMEADPEKQKRERLVAMEQAGRRISRMVRGLLDFSRREDYRFLLTDVNATIESILALIAPQIERGGRVRLVKEFAPGLPPISASARHLEQVWMNLLLNARDAVAGSPQGEVHIATRFDQGAGQVQVVVSDNGVGIPPENLGRLFEPFFTTKPPGQGTGLGLCIVQGIVQRHQGSVQVESKVGEGTAFTVSLPGQVAGNK